MMKKLHKLKNLTTKEAQALFYGFDQLTPAQQAATLTLLSAKHESVDEINAALDCISPHSTYISHQLPIVDIVGTGGDQADTFNISTAASLLMASAGAMVAKHGGKSASSQAGSQDTANALGIVFPTCKETVLKQLTEHNYAYLHAPRFNTLLEKYGPLRQSLKLPTIFNVIGPLLNPMRPTRMMLGVYRKDLLRKIAKILVGRNIEHALLVHADDGLDEISINGRTHLLEIQKERISEYTITPNDFGINQAPIKAIKGTTSEENANLISEIFAGKITNAKRDVVLLNAGAGLYVAGKAQSIATGMMLAKAAIDQGHAKQLLQHIRSTSCQPVF